MQKKSEWVSWGQRSAHETWESQNYTRKSWYSTTTEEERRGGEVKRGQQSTSIPNPSCNLLYVPLCWQINVLRGPRSPPWLKAFTAVFLSDETGSSPPGVTVVAGNTFQLKFKLACPASNCLLSEWMYMWGCNKLHPPCLLSLKMVINSEPS